MEKYFLILFFIFPASLIAVRAVHFLLVRYA